MSGSANDLVQRQFAEAQALEARGDLAGAEARYRLLLQQMPGQPLLLAHLALVRKAAGAFSEAEGLLRRAIAAVPNEPGFHNNLGNVLRNLKRHAEARASYRRALELNPNFGEAAYNLGTVLEDMERREEALASFRRAVALGYTNPAARVRICAQLLAQGQGQEALDEIESVIADNPGMFDAHYYRGVALSQMERFDDAIVALEKAVQLKPWSIEALHVLANNLKASNRLDEALDVYWRMVEVKPTEIPVHENLNRLAFEAGRKDMFLKSYTFARERIGDDPGLLVSEAQARMRRNEIEAATVLTRRALEIAPGRTETDATLGQLLARQGNFAESFEAFSRAVAGDPSAIVYKTEFGYALLQGNEPAQALAQFEAAHLMAPNDQLALAGLSLAYRALEDSRYHAHANIDSFVRVYPLKVPKGFADAESYNRALAEELRKLHTTTTEPLDQTLRGGTQTQGLLFLRKLKAIEQVRDQISEAVNDYLRELGHGDHPFVARRQGDDWSFTHSWSCKLRSSGFHTNHIHPMGWISSAYYVSLPDELEDQAARQGWLKFGESHLNMGGHDRPERFVKPQVGHLVLFPSYFWHGTVPFQSAHDRMTIAFDVVPGKIDPSAIGSGPY